MTESLNHFVPQFVTEKRYDKVKSILFYALFIQIITSIFIASFFYFGSEFIANTYFKSEAATEALKVFSLFFI
jgi:Na+-driven multidrug efflux pump